jgi:uncharacterized protein YbaR (Trm112 family)
MRGIRCPLCKVPRKLILTDAEECDTRGFYVRLYCENCRKAMTLTGTLVATAEEVEG